MRKKARALSEKNTGDPATNALRAGNREDSMESPSLELYGRALMDYLDGDSEVVITIRRDDGVGADLPAAYFFRTGAGFTPIDSIALERCRGAVLDIGAGAGCHSLILQERGLHVTAIDSIPHAVKVLKRRGVNDVRCEDIFRFENDPFDTGLMLGHGIGITGDLAGLDRFLEKMLGLIKPGGRLLVDSLDVRVTGDQSSLAYLEANRRAGRYRGEIRMRFEYRGQAGSLMNWLHADFDTLNEWAAAKGWKCGRLREESTGEYLACLTH